MSQARQTQTQKQKEKAISEAAKKLLEKLNSIYSKYKQLTEEKEHLLKEYNERLMQIESEITSLYAEAAQIIDELEREHGLTLNDISMMLASIPDEFFKQIQRIARRKISRIELERAVKKTYEEIMEQEMKEMKKPIITEAIKKITSVTAPSTIVKKDEREKDTFICPLCNESHNRETEQITITICRHCHALLETFLIPNKIFEGHGRSFVMKYHDLAEKARKLPSIEKAYSNLVKYLKNRGIRIPEELSPA